MLNAAKDLLSPSRRSDVPPFIVMDVMAAAAAREALTNVAKHAGVPRASLYAEIGPGAVEVFVRDRGVGFDPAAVPQDRHGVRDSIVGRLERYGGSATIRSAPGEGTEIHLSLEAA